MAVRWARSTWLCVWGGALAAMLLGLRLCLPLYRQQVAIGTLDRLGAKYEAEDVSPELLRALLPAELLTRFLVIRSIRLDDTEVGDRDLAALSGLADVETVSLEYTQISDLGMAHLSNLRSLRSLSLRSTRVTDDGLPSLRSLSRLESLSLRGTRISDAGLVELDGLPALKILYLGVTPVTQAARSEFARRHPAMDVRW